MSPTPNGQPSDFLSPAPPPARPLSLEVVAAMHRTDTCIRTPELARGWNIVRFTTLNSIHRLGHFRDADGLSCKRVIKDVPDRPTVYMYLD